MSHYTWFVNFKKVVKIAIIPGNGRSWLHLQILHFISLQTCGTPVGASCDVSQCGGLGCTTEDGKKKCGGDDCNGLVDIANSAWKTSMSFDKEILSAMTEVEELSKLVIITDEMFVVLIKLKLYVQLNVVS